MTTHLDVIKNVIVEKGTT